MFPEQYETDRRSRMPHLVTAFFAQPCLRIDLSRPLLLFVLYTSFVNRLWFVLALEVH